MNSPTLPQNFLNFPQLHLFVFVGLAKPLWSLAPVQPLTMAYKYRCLVLNCKTPRRSLRQLNETRRRIKKFYNYRSQSAAHQFSFKDFSFKFGVIAVVSFSMQVVWIYLSQRRGGDRDTNTTFHLPFASKVKFSSRVHLLNKIGKKHFERKTELF